MNTDKKAVKINLLGKSFEILCPTDEIETLHTSAKYLRQIMEKTKDRAINLNYEKLVVITALNIVSEHLELLKEKNSSKQQVKERIHHLNREIEKALSHSQEIEL